MAPRRVLLHRGGLLSQNQPQWHSLLLWMSRWPSRVISLQVPHRWRCRQCQWTILTVWQHYQQHRQQLQVDTCQLFSLLHSWSDNHIALASVEQVLVVVKRFKPLMALSGTVYRLASSMSDHTPVLFNVFEDWNEKCVVLHISFISFVINFD